MANTVADIRTAVRAKGYELDTTDPQLSMLNSVYRRVMGQRRWWFNQVVNDTSLTLSSGASTFSLAGVTDLAHVDAVRFTTATDNWVEPEFRPIQQVRALQNSDEQTSTPMYWSRSGSTVYVWPFADRAYTVSLDYVRQPTALTADGNATLLPDMYQDVLTWGVIKELCFRERDNDGRAIANEEYNQILDQMRHQDGLEQRQTPSRVVNTGEISSVNDPYATGRYGPAYHY